MRCDSRKAVYSVVVPHRGEVWSPLGARRIGVRRFQAEVNVLFVVAVKITTAVGGRTRRLTTAGTTLASLVFADGQNGVAHHEQQHVMVHELVLVIKCEHRAWYVEVPDW